MNAVLDTSIPGLAPPKRGKVRDVYDLGDSLLIVATDRISAYDHVLQPGIPGKGIILTQLSNFWFERLGAILPNHLIATELDEFPPRLLAALEPREHFEGRSILVRKAEVIPFECVARGYLAGSAFREYEADGVACGFQLPPGLERASRLLDPLFTPATKAVEGHDENVDYATVAAQLGSHLAARLREITLHLYIRGAAHAETCGLILADTKFELGLVLADAGDSSSPAEPELILVDEVLTPDSSRYWEKDLWTPGAEPASFDKQYVRNWLDRSGWNHESPAPELPKEVVEGTLNRYREAFVRLTGKEAPV